MSSFAVSPQTYEPCNKLDDVTSQAILLFEESTAFRYSSTVLFFVCACCFCVCLFMILEYWNKQGEHACLYEQVARENVTHGLPENYNFDEDMRTQGNTINPYEDEDLIHH